MEKDELLTKMKTAGNKEQAVKMSAYMQNHFPFLGIPKTILTPLMRPFLQDTMKSPLDWSLVQELWDNEYREAQYVAIAYIERHKKELRPKNLQMIKKLITSKSWWETVDSLDGFVGEIVLQDDRLKTEILRWACDDNIWLRRVAIDYQQRYKEKTDTEMLRKTIEANLNSTEFFINKAIGWSLREYSKTNPAWVRDFLEEYKKSMASLSIKEAQKLLEKQGEISNVS